MIFSRATADLFLHMKTDDTDGLKNFKILNLRFFA